MGRSRTVSAMRMQKPISILLLLAALVITSCNNNSENNSTLESKYRKLNDDEIKTVLVRNNFKKYPMFWTDDDGIDVFEGGYATILGNGQRRAVYEIKNSYFCVLELGQNRRCSYFITNGRRIFEVTSGKHPVVFALNICSLDQLNGLPRKCKTSISRASISVKE